MAAPSAAVLMAARAIMGVSFALLFGCLAFGHRWHGNAAGVSHESAQHAGHCALPGVKWAGKTSEQQMHDSFYRASN
jgi:hypothetical protein